LAGKIKEFDIRYLKQELNIGGLF